MLSLNFQKWEWLKVKEEEEDKSREMRGGRKKKRRYNAAVEQFRLDRNEVLRISETPFAKLVRKEVGIKKLLGKFHDDAELMRRKAEQNASGFNPFLAAETRHKDSATFTPEQKEVGQEGGRDKEAAGEVPRRRGADEAEGGTKRFWFQPFLGRRD